MKTIKELTNRELMKQTEFDGGYWQALKDVLGLIDELCYKDGFQINTDELKARITGCTV